MNYNHPLHQGSEDLLLHDAHRARRARAGRRGAGAGQSAAEEGRRAVPHRSAALRICLAAEAGGPGRSRAGREAAGRRGRRGPGEGQRGDRGARPGQAVLRALPSPRNVTARVGRPAAALCRAAGGKPARHLSRVGGLGRQCAGHSPRRPGWPADSISKASTPPWPGCGRKSSRRSTISTRPRSGRRPTATSRSSSCVPA